MFASYAGPQVFNVLKTACQDLVLRPQDENYQLTSADRVLQHGLGIIDSYGGGWFANSLPLTVWERTRLIELAYEYMTVSIVWYCVSKAKPMWCKWLTSPSDSVA